MDRQRQCGRVEGRWLVLATGLPSSALDMYVDLAPDTSSPIASRPLSPAAPLRVAVVGCGAVTEANLLPVLAGHELVRLVGLVDRVPDRARALADLYGVSTVLSDYAKLQPELVDGVVVATPPGHHAQATIELLDRGFHVLVEKPMALTRREAEAMVEAAERSRRALAVGLYRRLLPSVRLLRSLSVSGRFGQLQSIDIEEGGPYTWKLAALDGLTRTGGGGGVLIDIGSHLLDMLRFIVPGEITLVRCVHNGRGGIETECELELEVIGQDRRIPCRVELSRTRHLRNVVRVVTEEATLELPNAEFTRVFVRHRAPAAYDAAAGRERTVRLSAAWDDQPELIGYEAFRAEFDDWLTAIATGRQPVLSGRSVVPVVALIESCYARAARLEEPWTDEGLISSRGGGSLAPAVRVTRRCQRVLVTGAGGFLGGRAVELLAQRHGYAVRALVRTPSGAAHLSRWPREVVVGDVCSEADVQRALDGCDAVVHCAVGTSWHQAEAHRVTVEGTRTVAAVAERLRVQRFVHISTMLVHQMPDAPCVDEQAPLCPRPGDTYGQSKLAAERALRQAARSVPVICLRPTRIYGPFSRTFIVGPLQALAERRLVVGGNVEAPANMVYVDDVVEAIACALAARDSAAGEGFLVNDPEQLSLKAFYRYFADATGCELQVRPGDDAVPLDGPHGSWTARWWEGLKTVARSPEARLLAHRVLDTDPVGTLPRRVWERSPALQRRVRRWLHVDAAIVYHRPAAPPEPEVVFRVDRPLVLSEKAHALLGFAPRVGRERGMALTLAWAKYARLV
jgi:predicted dehydrogenase/nucleoside-diphosphate-sugar epimerase